MKWDGFYENAQSSESAEQLSALVRDHARSLGFDHVSYVICVPSLNGAAKRLRFEHMPAGWKERYAARKHAETDPVLRRAANSVEPLVWSQKLFAEAPQLWADAREFGLRAAISQSSWAAQGVHGVLTLLRGEPDFTAGELAMLRPHLRMLANLVHLAMYEHVDVPRINCVAEINLTTREREILRWTSEGKTAEIIGAILNISTRTVNFHIGNVLSKLVAVNKVQAVAKARTFGLL